MAHEILLYIQLCVNHPLYMLPIQTGGTRIVGRRQQHSHSLLAFLGRHRDCWATSQNRTYVERGPSPRAESLGFIFVYGQES